MANLASAKLISRLDWVITDWMEEIVQAPNTFYFYETKKIILC